MLVRPAAPQDLPTIQSIYAHHVLHGLASFEEEAPPLEEMRRRFDEVAGRGLPYFAAEEAGEVVGYAYCAPYRSRSAYRYTLEDSVYVREGRQGKGIGRALLGELVGACEALPYRQMIAVIGDSANLASVALHASLGFVRCGSLRSSGYKFGRWVDTVLMQRALGPGDGAKP
ncbi:MAG TPA: GNAT family N-acetyltransferase [Burkholderiales bacterium]|nr:GNAT family N-acetyltransferase [Burkholderiales bacterium]